MGSFLAYVLYSGVFLLMLYLLYKLFISGEKQIALNRTILLAIYAVSFAAWPLSQIMPAGAEPGETAMIAVGDLSVTAIEEAGESSSGIIGALVWVYVVGLALTFLWTAVSVIRLILYVRKGIRIRKPDHILVIKPGGSVAPFSFGRYIVMGASDYEAIGDTVTAHELAHIRCLHYVDLVVAQAVCVILWFNPASWLMREELSLIHEYQADSGVIDSGADPKAYQMLLVRKTVGTRFYTFANNLNHSKLKNRIAMMQKEKCSGLRRLRVLALAVAPVAALSIVNIPAVASVIDRFDSVSLNQDKEQAKSDAEKTAPSDSDPLRIVAMASVRKDADMVNSDGKEKHKDSSVSKRNNGVAESGGIHENLAEFPGGMQKMMNYLSTNIRYPFEAHKEHRTGRTVIAFTVEADGSLSNFKIIRGCWPDLDEEALRVVKSMPKWKPATTDGKAVASEYTLPVVFSLQDTSVTLPGKPDNEFEEIIIVGYGNEKNGKKEIRFKENEKADSKVPVYVDGKLWTKSINELDPEKIQSIQVWKDNTDEYPNGKIDVKLKK